MDTCSFWISANPMGDHCGKEITKYDPNQEECFDHVVLRINNLREIAGEVLTELELHKAHEIKVRKIEEVQPSGVFSKQYIDDIPAH